MRTLLALFATVLAYALARPPAVTNDPPPPVIPPQPSRQRAPVPPSREFLTEYLIPHLLLPHYLGPMRYDDQLRLRRPPNNNFLDQEIEMINEMQLDENGLSPYEAMYPRWDPVDSPTRHLGRLQQTLVPAPQIYADIKPEAYASSPLRLIGDRVMKKASENIDEDPRKEIYSDDTEHQGTYGTKVKDIFAMTPLERGYFENVDTEDVVTAKEEEPEYNSVNAIIDPRKIRQNPNLSRTKMLIAEHVDRLRTGFTRDDVDGTARPQHIHILETPAAESGESIYSIALIAAVGAALTVAIVGFAFGLHTLSKKAKAAADVDYPAYGVTGPNVDTSADRKLAQSAHMYHYQHQKQQIIAMERNGMDRNGSVSDPDSEEENEEGDYTVYECPGFATTGEMEVKNPLFKEEGTPATPAKSDEEKVQPKE